MITQHESNHWEMAERLAGGVVLVRSVTVRRVIESALYRKRTWTERLVEWLSR